MRTTNPKSKNLEIPDEQDLKRISRGSNLSLQQQLLQIKLKLIQKQ